MVTPAVVISRTKVPLGTPVEMTYKFVVARDAKFTMDYHVMVHFGDQDDQLMYVDDHDPPKPTSQWKPGETIEYTRTFFTLWERVKPKFIAEVNNMFNRENITSLTTAVAVDSLGFATPASNFLQPSATVLEKRIVQFGVRLDW